MFRNYPDPLLDLREPFVEEMLSIFIPMLEDGSGTRLQILVFNLLNSFKLRYYKA